MSKRIIFFVALSLFSVLALLTISYGFQQPPEQRADWFQLAISIFTLPTIVAISLLYGFEFRKLTDKPKIELGLVHYDNATSHLPVDTTKLIEADVARPTSANAITFLVIKNVGTKAARNIKFSVQYESDLGNLSVTYKLFSQHSLIKQYAERGNKTIFHSVDWYLGGTDEQIIHIDLNAPSPNRPIGKHAFKCAFWADELDEPVEGTFSFTVLSPE